MFHLDIAILYHLVVVQLKNIVLCELNWYGIDLYWNNHVNVVILGLHTCLSIINFICTIALYPICNLHAYTECTVKVNILLHHSDHFDMISCIWLDSCNLKCLGLPAVVFILCQSYGLMLQKYIYYIMYI